MMMRLLINLLFPFKKSKEDRDAGSGTEDLENLPSGCTADPANSETSQHQKSKKPSVLSRMFSFPKRSPSFPFILPFCS